MSGRKRKVVDQGWWCFETPFFYRFCIFFSAGVLNDSHVQIEEQGEYI